MKSDVSLLAGTSSFHSLWPQWDRTAPGVINVRRPNKEQIRSFLRINKPPLWKHCLNKLIDLKMRSVFSESCCLLDQQQMWLGSDVFSSVWRTKFISSNLGCMEIWDAKVRLETDCILDLNVIAAVTISSHFGTTSAWQDERPYGAKWDTTPERRPNSCLNCCSGRDASIKSQM